MTTPKTCTIVVGVEKTGRHIITRCGKPATHKGFNIGRYFCKEHAAIYGSAQNSPKLKIKASK